MSANDLLTVDEFAELARVSSRTVRRWLKSGRIQAIRQGKRYLIARAETPGARLDAQSATTPAPASSRRLADSALSGLLFWICDRWVDESSALTVFAQTDPEAAAGHFAGLVRDVDREAAEVVDEETALRLRLVVRDLQRSCLSLQREGELSEDDALPGVPLSAYSARPGEQPLPALPTQEPSYGAATLPLASALDEGGR